MEYWLELRPYYPGFHNRVPCVLTVEELSRPVLAYRCADGFWFRYRTYDYHLTPLSHIQQLLLGRSVIVERSEQLAFRIPVGKVSGLHHQHLNEKGGRIVDGQVFDEIRRSLYLAVFFREAVEVAVGHFLQFIPGYIALAE